MKLLENEQAVFVAYSRKNWLSANSGAGPKYSGLSFECGCEKKTHSFEIEHYRILATAFPVYFLVVCANEFVSLVRVKGLFRQRSITEWTCHADLLATSLLAMGLDYAVMLGNSRGNPFRE